METFSHPKSDPSEHASHAVVQVEPAFLAYVPQAFRDDPVGYVEREGKNIKTGDITYDASGAVREDPTAVKDLPVWTTAEGTELHTVVRRVNSRKGAVGESGDPFYEYTLLTKLAELGLPAARPVATAEAGEIHLIVMERIPGIRWSERDSLELRNNGYSDDDIAALVTEAQEKMNELKKRFDDAGVIRSWKLEDMVFDVDVPNKKIRSIVPTDWERTRIVERK